MSIMTMNGYTTERAVRGNCWRSWNPSPWMTFWTIRDAGRDFEKEGRGAFQIFTTPQVVRLDCYGMQEADLNALIDLFIAFGCPLYDPQVSTRFDGWTDR